MPRPPAAASSATSAITEPAPAPLEAGPGGWLALGLFFALAAAAVLARRRRRPAERRLEVVETVSLGPRRSLLLVRLGGREAVLGASEAGVQLLMSFEAAPGGERAPSPFEALLEKSEEQLARAALAGRAGAPS